MNININTSYMNSFYVTIPLSTCLYSQEVQTRHISLAIAFPHISSSLVVYTKLLICEFVSQPMSHTGEHPRNTAHITEYTVSIICQPV